ncbi:hypothetical protein Pint_08627 [Pistacia integerrima]|uniref:Uncharacterized protein n=1 Tax=Pistacia integerrima TaxID=434235 RepID=A0ACC0XWZ4_9ROSI|nr:hypothetical protein Pint_08627 [Pistacia integerrima]
MKGKHNQSKFMRFIRMPFRVLGKARDFYVRSLTEYAAKGNYGGQFPSLPKSFSVGASRSNASEDYSELIRAASVRSMGHRNEVDLLIHQHLMQSAANRSKEFPKSSSVGMKFMGRIEEEKSCDLEDSVDGKRNKSDYNKFPRSRSVAVSNRSPGL